MDQAAIEDWIRIHVQTIGPLEKIHERPWATVFRVPLADRNVFFKACASVQRFEPRLTAQLYGRWPDLVAEVLGYDEGRAWLLLGDAGVPIREFGNPPEAWLAVLPLYAELQIGEASHAHDHLAHGVRDLRIASLPARYQDLLQHDLPLAGVEIDRLRAFAGRFDELCGELKSQGLGETIQHDDLHMVNLFKRGNRFRLLDWGDASISHPFASLVVTFRFLEEFNKLPPTDRWFARLRDAYLEPWGNRLQSTFGLALRIGTFAHAFAWTRQRDALPVEAMPQFDIGFQVILRRALAQTLDPPAHAYA
jgi:hypothetical protein